jgi:serine/threonine protein kinase/tetratricopeptide (TPR) repeat protein
VVSEEAGSTDPFQLVGQTLERRFRIERKVAEGGFGVIYRAWQLALDRAVALKVLKVPAGLTVAERGAFLRAFQGEARTSARLKHPHIVEVHDFGVSEWAGSGPLHWMALEWLEGRTLEDLLEEKRTEPPMRPVPALQLMRPVLEAIAYAHRLGVVHRDLKPGNIFLVQSSGVTIPKVLDFGIAKLLAGPDEVAKRTTQGLSGFSPDYVAPEQILRKRTGPPTDVHALALIMTEILTGRPPYADTADHLSAVLSEQRPTPGARGIDVDAWEAVLVRALSLRPADRYPDAGGFLVALAEGLASGAATLPATAPAPPRPRSPRTRRFAGLVVGLLMVAAAVVGSWRAWRSSPGPKGRLMMAVLPFANIAGDPQQQYLADGLTEGMITQLGRMTPDRLAVIARTSVMQYRDTRKSIKEIGRELNVAYVLECSVQRAGSRLRIGAQLIQVSDQSTLWTDSYDREMKDALNLQSEVAQVVAAQVRLKLTPQQAAGLSRVRSLNPAAYDAYLKGRFFRERATLEGYRRAVASFQEALALDPGYAAAYAELAEAYAIQPLAAEVPSELVVPQARAAALRSLELDDQLAEGHAILAVLLAVYGWDWAGAQEHFLRALTLDPNNADTRRHYARAYLLPVGRYTEAIDELKRAIELSPLSLSSNESLGHAYYSARRYDQAIAQLRKTIALDPTFYRPHFVLGRVYLAQGRLQEARAEADVVGNHGSDPAYLRALVRGPEAMLAQIQRLKAAPELDSMALAMLYTALGRRDDAFTWLEQAYRERAAGLTGLQAPIWDPLRTDPRLAHLMARVGIPSAAASGVR